MSTFIISISTSIAVAIPIFVVVGLTLSYSTRTNDSGAATHNERRFQFRLFNRLFRVFPGFMGKSLVIAVRS